MIKEYIALHKKYSYLECFWWVLSRIWTEYGDLGSKYPEIWGVNIRIQSKCGKKQSSKTPNAETFYAVLRAETLSLSR